MVGCDDPKPVLPAARPFEAVERAATVEIDDGRTFTRAVNDAADAVDDVMEDAEGDEEEEGDKILKEVLDEIGIGLQQQVRRVKYRLNIRSYRESKPAW